MQEQPTLDLEAQGPFLRRLAASLVGDGAPDAGPEDLAQDVWLAGLEGRPAAGVPLRAWLVRVACNLAAGRRRGAARRSAREREAARPESQEVAAGPEVAEGVLAAVRALPEPYRGALWQRYYEDLSNAEIARRAGVPPRTVETWLRRGRKRVRDHLERKLGPRERWTPALATLARGEAQIPTVVGLALGLVFVAALVGGFAVFLHRGAAEPERNLAGLDPPVLEGATVSRSREPAAGTAVENAPAQVEREALETTAPDGPGAGRVQNPAPPTAPARLRVEGRVHLLDGVGTKALAVALIEDTGGEPGRVVDVGGRFGPDLEFVLRAPPGAYWVVAASINSRPGSRRIELGPGDVTGVDVVLRAGEVCRGHVVDPEGQAFEGATLALNRLPRSRTWTVSRALMFDGVEFHAAEAKGVTAEEGRFDLAGLSAGSYRVSITPDHDGWAHHFLHMQDPLWDRALRVPRSDGDLVLHTVMTRLAVEGPSGPIPGLKMAWGLRPDIERIEAEGKHLGGTSGPDRDGRMYVVHDPRSEVVVRFRRHGYHTVNVVLAEAERDVQGVVPVSMEPLPSTSTVRVSLGGALEKPAPGTADRLQDHLRPRSSLELVEPDGALWRRSADLRPRRSRNLRPGDRALGRGPPEPLHRRGRGDPARGDRPGGRASRGLTLTPG